jgi:hypothetical protein
MLTVTDLPSRIAARINESGPLPPDPFTPIETPCWLWTGWHNDQGYGYLYWQGRDQPAHRVIHELLTGQPLAGFDRDHLCRIVSCVRPDHGERVPHAENQRRLSLHQVACRRAGHDWTNPNNVRVRPNGRRYCAECDRISLRARYAARTGRAAA